MRLVPDDGCGRLCGRWRTRRSGTRPPARPGRRRGDRAGEARELPARLPGGHRAPVDPGRPGRARAGRGGTEAAAPQGVRAPGHLRRRYVPGRRLPPAADRPPVPDVRTAVGLPGTGRRAGREASGLHAAALARGGGPAAGRHRPGRRRPGRRAGRAGGSTCPVDRRHRRPALDGTGAAGLAGARVRRADGRTVVPAAPPARRPGRAGLPGQRRPADDRHRPW